MELLKLLFNPFVLALLLAVVTYVVMHFTYKTKEDDEEKKKKAMMIRVGVSLGVGVLVLAGMWFYQKRSFAMEGALHTTRFEEPLTYNN